MKKALWLIPAALLIAESACKKGEKGFVAPTSTTPHIVNDCADPVQYNTPACPTRTAIAMGIQFQSTVAGQEVPWTFTFAGLSISGTQKKWTVVEGLSVQDYEVAGQVQGAVNIALSPMSAPHVSGAFKPNSILSLEGPVASTGCLSINYIVPGPNPAPQNFKFKFTFMEGLFVNPC